MRLYIGIDDTDSVNKYCTTYIGYVVSTYADKFSATIVHFPKLIRLNPNIPYKTRGNAAISFTFDIDNEKVAEFENEIIKKVEQLSDLDDKNTNPGIVFLEKIPKEVSTFSKRALKYHVTIEDAEKILQNIGAKYHKYKNGRGIIGALAAIGYVFNDCTYEIISYRKKERWGTKRTIDKNSVFSMNTETLPYTINNIDRESKKILICPNTACPIFCGIRGENPKIVQSAFETLSIDEELQGSIIYQTNQHTDDNVIEIDSSSAIEDMTTIKCRFTVLEDPITIKGSHTFFLAGNDTIKVKICSFSKNRALQKVAQKLRRGDNITVWGSVSLKEETPTLHLEKMKVGSCVSEVVETNPTCPICNKTGESAGKNQEFRCRKCKTTLGYEKIRKTIDRDIVGFYEPPESSQRHLHKQIRRYENVVAR